MHPFPQDVMKFYLIPNKEIACVGYFKGMNNVNFTKISCVKVMKPLSLNII